ncbi:MAG: hypothetical protein VR69_13075 [Peptococcaceae bacterium BRH_c4b]|nr:MAG: hypothetical protein VR69_13075 [Peptococcaceae bacterium BRH_c4b]
MLQVATLGVAKLFWYPRFAVPSPVMRFFPLMGDIAPPAFRFSHNQLVVRKQRGRGVSKNIIYRFVFSAPSVATEGAALPMLAGYLSGR